MRRRRGGGSGGRGGIFGRRTGGRGLDLDLVGLVFLHFQHGKKGDR